MIKLAIFDFDGTFTNGKVEFDNNGGIIKHYNVKDGKGIILLQKKNIKTCIISGYKNNNALKEISNHLNIDYVYENVDNKVEKINELLNILDLTFEETSYMGDDINDIKLLNLVKYSGCPNDAVKECLQCVDFISKRNGGNGCVREFCDFLLMDKNYSGLICVKYFSKRLPKKNFLKFGNTTLLNNKIDILLSLNFLSEVIINTESDELISIVKNNYCNNKKLKIIKRNCIYSMEHTESYDFCKNVADSCNYDNILYSPITCPLITKKTYNNMYKNYNIQDCDSVVLISDGIKGGGHSNENHNFCFGSCLISKKNMIELDDTMGKKYFIQKCDRKERIDIDYESDYKRALYYYHNLNKEYDENILQYLTNPLYNINNSQSNNKKIKLIDCTVRDGGFTNNWKFDYDVVMDMLNIDIDLNLEYFELGYLIDDKYLQGNEPGMWRNCSYDLIKKIKKETNNQIKLSLMIDHWRFDFEKLPSFEETKIDLIRICNYIENIEDTLTTCKILHNKGYKTSVNIIASSYLTNLDLIKIKAFMISEKYIDWYYFADSFGSMVPSQVEEIVTFFKNDPRTSNVKLGFHGHNNSQIGMANTLKAIECGVDMVDGTYGGKGRGGGNLPLENIILYLKIIKKYDFNIDLFLNFLYNFYKKENLDTYIIRNTVAGFMNIHPYRLKKYDDITNMADLYNKLSILPEAKKKDYKL